LVGLLFQGEGPEVLETKRRAHEQPLAGIQLYDYTRKEFPGLNGKVHAALPGISWHQSAPDNTSDDMRHNPDSVRFIVLRPMVPIQARSRITISDAVANITIEGR
jgi:hypothetical protein